MTTSTERFGTRRATSSTHLAPVLDWDTEPQQRAARIARVKSAIADGTYQVAADQVAAALVSDAIATRAGAADRPPTRTRPRGRIERLVRDHLPLVAEVVNRVAARFPQHVDRSELLDAGRMGLVEAAFRYDPVTGVPFRRYAAIRIRGAVLDSTRSRDWVSRGIRRQVRALGEAERELTMSDGKVPGTADLAESLGIDPAGVARLRAHTTSSMVLSLDFQRPGAPRQGDLIPDGNAGPDDTVEQQEMVGALREAVMELPGTHGEAVRRYYYGGELLQAIAADFGVTEARVSQIIAEAVTALRHYFSAMYEGVPEIDERAPGKRVRAELLTRLTERSTSRSRLIAGEAAPKSVGETDVVEVTLFR